jgi:hypothetical protein
MDNEEEAVSEQEQCLIDISVAMLEAAKAHPGYNDGVRIFLSIASDNNDEATGIGQFHGYDGTSPMTLISDIHAFLQGTRGRTGLAMGMFLPRPSAN